MTCVSHDPSQQLILFKCCQLHGSVYIVSRPLIGVTVVVSAASWHCVGVSRLSNTHEPIMAALMFEKM